MQVVVAKFRGLVVKWYYAPLAWERPRVQFPPSPYLGMGEAAGSIPTRSIPFLEMAVSFWHKIFIVTCIGYD